MELLYSWSEKSHKTAALNSYCEPDYCVTSPQKLNKTKQNKNKPTTGSSSRGPRFNSQHQYSSTYLSVTPVPEDPMPSYGHKGKQTPVYIKFFKNLKIIIFYLKILF